MNPASFESGIVVYNFEYLLVPGILAWISSSSSKTRHCRAVGSRCVFVCGGTIGGWVGETNLGQEKLNTSSKIFTSPSKFFHKKGIKNNKEVYLAFW